jgi:hypothetical protein
MKVTVGINLLTVGQVHFAYTADSIYVLNVEQAVKPCPGPHKNETGAGVRVN